MYTLRLRVFVSSPDDLSAERVCAKEVLEGLSGETIGGWQVFLEPMLWEVDSPPVVGQKAQQAIDYYFGRAGETDIYIGMLWSTLGSPVVLNDRRYASGTLYEFEDAYARSKSVHQPKMLLYRCDRPSDAPADRLQQVNNFFASFKGEFPAYEGSPARFVETEQFRERLTRDLRRVLERIVEERQAEQRTPAQLQQGRSGPDSGRAVLLRELDVFLRNYDDIFGEGREHQDAFPVRFVRLDEACGLPSGQAAVEPIESLLKIYESAGRRLLFVGEGGSGKTFAMLRLRQQLVERATQSPAAPLPVYLNLASWTPLFSSGKAGSSGIAGWVIDELVRRYSIPRRAAADLVNNRKLVFCLDGIDEIGHRAEETSEAPVDGSTRALWQKTCIASINRLLKDESVELVLCGRLSLLESLDAKLDVGCRLQIEPLDAATCVAYLQRWANLDGLREALEQSPMLAAKLQNPLFLRMMSVAYRGMRPEPIVAAVGKSEFQWQTHLIDNYIRHCLSLIPNEGRWYFSSEAPRYLSWFAAHAEPDFLLEDLQPSMLFSPLAPEGDNRGSPRERPEPDQAEHAVDEQSFRRYRLTSNLALAVILSLIAAVPLGLAIGIEWSASATFAHSLARGGLLAGLALAVTLLMGFPAFASGRWWIFGGLLGGAFAIVRGLTVGLSAPDSQTGGTLAQGIAATLATWPVSTVVFMLLGYQMFSAVEEHRNRYRSKAGIRWYEIQPLESLDWRWIDSRSRWRGGWLGLLIGPACGAFLWLLFGPARGLAFGILITVFVSMFSGFLGTGIRISLEPNQGIVRSFRHALLMGALFTGGAVIACSISYGVVHGTREGVVNGVLGLSASLVALALGGIPVVRHVCLGHVLHGQGATPTWWSWRPWTPTVRFLEDMVRYKLLRRTAGGYSFRHGMIRDYFVRLWHERFADGDRV